VEVPLDWHLRIDAGEGNHTVKVIYKSAAECQHRWHHPLVGRVAFLGYDAEGPAQLSPDPRKTIELVGDSITEGVLIDTCYHEYRNYYFDEVFMDDVCATYAYLTAEAFGADSSIISESAIAMDGSWFGDGRTIFDHYNSYSYHREVANNTTYAFDYENARVPDLVDIKLGTNDSALTGNGKTNPDKTKAAVKSLINLIRENYGENVPIVYASGMLGRSGATWTAIDTAIAELGGESAGIYTVTLPGDAVGQSSHPSAQANANAANTLTAFIRSKNLLG
jgi:hypothetical protein